MYPYLGVELACRTKALMPKALSGEVRAQPLSRGGSAYGSKHNTRVLYSGVVTDSPDDRPLDSIKYPFFDTLHLVYLYNKMKKGEAVPTTKVRHDYILAFEDILFIVCEALSTNLEEELIKIIMSLVKMIIYLDVAYGIISTATKVYVVKLWWDMDGGRYLYQVYCLPYRKSNTRDRDAHGLYGVGCWEIVKIVAAIMRNQQLDLDRIIARNMTRYPYTESWAREVIPSRTVYVRSCALYLGTDVNTLGDKTTLDYQNEVYFNAQSHIQTAQQEPDCPQIIKDIPLFQLGGVNANIDRSEVEKEESWAEGEPGKDADIPTDTLTHSTLRTKLVEQEVSEFHFLESQAVIINSQRSDSPTLSTESLGSDNVSLKTPPKTPPKSK